MPFTPEALPPTIPPFFQDGADNVWTPIYAHECAFGPEIFRDKMTNLIQNPNLNSSWLFRADILCDYTDDEPSAAGDDDAAPLVAEIRGYHRQRTVVRRLIPRNEQRDAPMVQTCIFYQQTIANTSKLLLVYFPHCSSPQQFPHYHPRVRGIAHLHEWDVSSNVGRVSVHFLAFPEEPIDDRLRRIGYHLLETITKHGKGGLDGYVKRVNLDRVVPQKPFQERFALLKAKYARSLFDMWAEKTDPGKHVFEDLSIAAFLIQLWADMYKGKTFPGFVDIGCGNGLLVYILIQEGFSGWGFDARQRKSWEHYTTPVSCSPSGDSLAQRLLLPAIIPIDASNPLEGMELSGIHDGLFPEGTFIISNHADELTPWTPILATQSRCPFIMIPCCSHNLSADKFRAPPPRDKSKGKSQYASLVDWVTRISEDCGWQVETEMLRIPSTRNMCIIGRKREEDNVFGDTDELQSIIQEHGGAGGYHANVAKLLKAESHATTKH
ncbi:hypothetical protein B0I35DRAFT_453552 [Stachybotrys elegans]|uniref:tRNA (uracil-O(2)-)-methyltransferase n=1 Tax=Stachybotrys elegans TaxID=80388 RepID=A0A8K0SML8_9HYPO|nr:hypothetical protein B0I35DRAFT_453552 [Stachybotrys elegans]